MPTVIDSLVITLGLDASKFNEEQRKATDQLRKFEEAANKHVKPVNKGMEDLVATFKEMQGRLLAIGALIATGLGFNRLVQDITKTTTEVGYLSKALGMAAQDLSAWENAGKTVGASTGEMAQNLKAINSEIQEFHATGSSKLQAFMGQVGIKPMQPNDTPDAVAKRLSEWYQGQSNKAFASHLLQSRGGLSQGMINFLALGPEEIQKRLDQAKRFAPTNEEIEKFKKLQEAFANLMTVVDRLATQALVPFIERLTKILNLITDWLGKFSESKDTVPNAAGRALGGVMPELTPNAQKPSLMQRGWNWMLGRPGGFSGPSGNGEGAGAAPSTGGAGGGGGVQDRFGNWQQGPGGGTMPAAPGTSPEGARPTAPGAVGQGSEFLRQQRQGFTDQLNDPGVRQRVAGMGVLEGTPQHSIESLANRFGYVNSQRAQQGLPPLTVDQMLRSGFYGPINRGGLPGAVNQLQRNPALADRMERAIQGVTGGSNLTRGYTDQGMPTDPNGSLRSQATARDHIRIGGNEFTDWAGGPGGRGAARAYRDRLQSGVANEQQQPAAANSNEPGPNRRIIIDGGSTEPQNGAQRTFENWRNLGLGAGGAVGRGGVGPQSYDNSNTSTTNIHSMNVTVPPGADASAYADGIQRRLGDYNNVQNANTGLV
jgi:hypothetical protein